MRRGLPGRIESLERQAPVGRWRPWVLVDPSRPTVRFPGGAEVPTEQVDAAFMARRTDVRYVTICPHRQSASSDSELRSGGSPGGSGLIVDHGSR